MYPRTGRCCSPLPRHGLGPAGWRWPVALLLTVMLPLALAGGAVTIGPDPGCDYDHAVIGSVQSALDAGATDVRLVGGYGYPGPVTVTLDGDVSIRGGFASCAEAALGQLPAEPEPAVLSWRGDEPQLLHATQGTASNARLELSRVHLFGASWPGAQANGLVAEGQVRVIMRHGAIAGFSPLGSGGGVLLDRAQLYLNDVRIQQNTALHGAGIYCTQGLVSLDQDSEIWGNAAGMFGADGRGGGVYLDRCTFTSEARAAEGPDGAVVFRGIAFNWASDRGGGIYADDSLVRIWGGPACSSEQVCRTHPATIVGNEAGVGGGGLAAVNASQVELNFTGVLQNSAGHAGGGILVESGSQVLFAALDGLYPHFDRSACWENTQCDGDGCRSAPRACSLLAGNQATDVPGGSGGGIAVDGGSFSSIGLVFRANGAAQGARDIDVRGGGSLLLLQAYWTPFDQLALDAGQSMLRIADTASAAVRRSTLFGQGPGGFMIQADPGAELELNGALMIRRGDGAVLDLAETAVGSGVCNAVMGVYPHDEIIEARPVGENDFDFFGSPTEASGLLDACSAAGLPVTARDTWLNPRVTVWQSPLNPVDIGALERPVQTLFLDGFEP